MKYEDINTPLELLDFMDIIEYGFEKKDGTRICNNDVEFEKNILSWTLSSPKRLLKTRLGHCFDQVELERDWFIKHNYEFETYFMIFELPYENDGPTHTFLVYKENNKYYHFEHSDGLNRGIHEYNSLEECLNSAYQKQKDYAKNYCDLKDNELETLSIYEYEEPEYNIDFQSFIDYILDNGHKIK